MVHTTGCADSENQPGVVNRKAWHILLTNTIIEPKSIPRISGDKGIVLVTYFCGRPLERRAILRHFCVAARQICLVSDKSMFNLQRFLNHNLRPWTFVLNLVQTRSMSKYLSKAAKKRLPLTTKRASRGGFYKGKGGTKEGRLNSKGRFIVNPLKRLELVIPDLTGFKLKPYIAASVPKFPPEQQRNRVPK